MARSTAAQGVQVGVEATPGTVVPANKSLGSVGFALSPSVESSTFRPRGTKYPTVVTPNQEWTEGDVTGQPTYEEVVVPLSSVFTRATVTEVMDGATATGAYDWVFEPESSAADAPVTFTVESGDANQAERTGHVLVTDFGLDISRSEISQDGTAIGQRLESGVVLTPAPTPYSDVLTPITPGQVCIYVADTVAGLDDAATARQGTVLSASPSIGGRFNPVWYLNCVLDSFATYAEAPEPDFTLDYVVEANDNGLAWLNYFRTGKTQFVRIEATGPQIYAGVIPVNRLFQWDFAVKVSEPGELSDEDGIYALHPTLQVVHDPGWGRATRVHVVNTVASL